MLTLSIVRTDFKKLLKWGGVALAIIIFIFILFRIGLILKNSIFPPESIGPTVVFGQISEPIFPESIKKDFNYEVDTISGELPAFNNLTNVYKMEERGPDILAVDNANQRASALGFNRNSQQISDFIYKWTTPEAPVKTLTQNIKLNEFKLTSTITEFESDLKNRNFNDQEEAISTARTFLHTLNIYPEDIDEENIKVEFSSIEGGVIRPTTRIVNSNLATIYFFQQPKEEIPIVYPQGPNSSMRLLVGADSRSGNVLDANFSHQNILEESATYPIKTADMAFEDLKNGDGFIIAHTGNNTEVKIKNVYLALYYSGQQQELLTPVIVFEGDNNFLAYVPAIIDEWIDN